MKTEIAYIHKIDAKHKVAQKSGKEESLSERIISSINRTTNYYLQCQHPEGYWWFELESNVTITAEYLMLLKFLGIENPEREQKIVTHLLRKQRSDGTWAIYYDGPGEISATVEAYFALKLAGYPEDSEEMTSARDFILKSGGVENCRIFTKIFLALFGNYSWERIPPFPVELILFPDWFPFSIYAFSSWTRASLVPISILLHLRPVKTIEGARVDELYVSSPNGRKKPSNCMNFLIFSRHIGKLLFKAPFRPLRNKALKRAEEWIVDHQEESGDWAGIQPAMVNSLLALSSLGYPLDHPVIQKGLEALETFLIDKGDEVVLQSCISPVWDTALNCLALVEAGIPPKYPAIQLAAEWLLKQQIFRGGDWQVKRPDLEPGGWAFEFHNDHYPDVDDSAVVLMALQRAVGDNPSAKCAIERGINWVLGMQSSDGGWGAFDVDNNKEYLNRIPFADLEAMIDPSTADLTGRVLQMMGYYGYDKDHPVAKKAIRFLRKIQEPDGSWWGRWGVNYIYGTWSVLSGLESIKEDFSQPWIQKAVQWLKNCQNPDGGWGETCESYKDPSLSGHGPSTASQTAWALLGLMAAGEWESPEISRGIQYLLKNQQPDGTWEEEYFTGTGFPKYFMLRYHNYRNCFPLMALGRYYGWLQDQLRLPGKTSLQMS